MELQEGGGCTAGSPGDFPGGRRVYDAEQQADHQVAPEQPGELLGHFRRAAAEQSVGPDVSDEAWAEAASSRINAHAVAHLSKLWATFRTRTVQYEVTDTIEKLGGRKPKTFAEFVAEEKLFDPMRPWRGRLQGLQPPGAVQCR